MHDFALVEMTDQEFCDWCNANDGVRFDDSEGYAVTCLDGSGEVIAKMISVNRGLSWQMFVKAK